MFKSFFLCVMQLAHVAVNFCIFHVFCYELCFTKYIIYDELGG